MNFSFYRIKKHSFIMIFSLSHSVGVPRDSTKYFLFKMQIKVADACLMMTSNTVNFQHYVYVMKSFDSPPVIPPIPIHD